MSEKTRIKILGGGCSRCKALEASVQKALASLGIDEKIDHVTDYSQIAAYGVMETPALVIDEKVVSYGKVLKPAEVEKILKSIS
ncbi:MAG: thioredoxin family protein [Sphaerochaetaceae bacterium]|jgi:small redox-active disulfide protein 2|nr:thioredoxin family protein [Sphaerochaetaceae bacterium]MDD3163474.1 thioredoxin family protein [Sphaerochaetaceae bacterium]MDD4007450.1 thioredoxin family protein [Sphaerochaetaceae bacterium]MDD4396621.1 thioredoxin family protein [Sphaerochaetaceae bacterium]